VARPVSERSEPASGSAAGVTGPESSQRVRVEVVEERAPACDLVVLGCDPSFALVADQLRRERGVEVLWCQLGSRGALEALAAGQAQVVGVHLYDAGSGEYNAPWVRKLVPFACTIVRFAEWEQELIVHAGNPLQIGGVDDLARPAVRFVNRELGSGSRALLDRRLAEAGVPGEAIPGYASTAAAGHLSVAEAIASGVADAGVALRAAGQAFGLAGIALGRERYDLVVPDHFLDLPAVQALLDVLRSRTLQTQIELLGGYDVSAMGQPS
jgi:putative molybdopterin biosynthesis protein